jgi:hypothetical protein
MVVLFIIVFFLMGVTWHLIYHIIKSQDEINDAFDFELIQLRKDINSILALKRK